MFNCKIEFVARGHEGDAGSNQKVLCLARLQFTLLTSQLVWLYLLLLSALHPLNDILDDEFYESYPIMFQYPRLSGDSVGSTIYGFEALGYSREARVIMWNKSLLSGRHRVSTTFMSAANGLGISSMDRPCLPKTPTGR